MIDQAEQQAGSARQTLESIRKVDEAGLSRNSPKHPRTPRATGRHKYYAKDDTRVMYGESQERMTKQLYQISKGINRRKQRLLRYIQQEIMTVMIQ